MAATAAAHGFDVLRARLMWTGGRRRLLVTVEQPGGEVTVDALTEFSNDLAHRLDRDETLDGPYLLECESPGPDRPLRLPGDAARFLGEWVAIKVAGKGRRTVRGRLDGADEFSVRLSESPAGEGERQEVSVPLSEIDEVHLEERPDPRPAPPGRKGRRT